MSNLTERKPGITTTSEEVRRVLSAETFGQLNQVYSDEVAKIMLDAWSLEKSVSPRSMEFIRGTAEKKKSGFREIFMQIAQNQKMEVADEMAVTGAWGKVMKRAEERFKELLKQAELERLQSSAPPLPTQNAPEPEEIVYEVEPILEDELEVVANTAPELPETLRAGVWAEWGVIPLNKDSLAKFNNAFVPELGRVVESLTPAQLKAVQGMYNDIIFNMYASAQEKGADMKALKMELERALPSYWRETLNSARLFSPMK